MTEKDKTTYFKQSPDDKIPFNVTDAEIKFELSEDIRRSIDEWILRYPPEQKKSGVFEALRLVQQANTNALTVPLMDAVADYLDMPRISVYEIAAFYTLYNLNPMGEHIIDVCTNISCRLNGAEKLLKHIEKRLKIGINGTTADGKITLREVECLGACITPPVCMVGKKYHVNLTPEKIDELLNSLSGKE